MTANGTVRNSIMSSIQERRKARYSKNKIIKNDDLYKSNDPSVSIRSVEAPTREVSVSTSRVKEKTKRKLTLEDMIIKNGC